MAEVLENHNRKYLLICFQFTYLVSFMPTTLEAADTRDTCIPRQYSPLALDQEFKLNQYLIITIIVEKNERAPLTCHIGNNVQNTFF